MRSGGCFPGKTCGHQVADRRAAQRGINVLQLARRPQRALPALFREAADGSKDRKILSGGYPRNSEDGHLQQANRERQAHHLALSICGQSGAIVSTRWGVPGRLRRPKWGGYPNTGYPSCRAVDRPSHSAWQWFRCACVRVLFEPSEYPLWPGECQQSAGSHAA